MPVCSRVRRAVRCAKAAGVVLLSACSASSTEPVLGLVSVRNASGDTVAFLASTRPAVPVLAPAIGSQRALSRFGGNVLAPGAATLVALDTIPDFQFSSHVQLAVYRVSGGVARYETSISAPGLALQQMGWRLTIQTSTQ